MSDKITLSRRADNLDISPEFSGYSKVIIYIDDETYVEAGNDSGRVLEFYNPFGTQSLANDLLAKLQGYQYQPYHADGALLDPAAEIGDGVSVSNVYGGLYSRDKHFGRLMKTDIAAPHDEEIDHEYQYESEFERRYKREYAETQAELAIQATEISAKVTADTSSNKQTFGWKLTSSSWEVYSNNQTVLKATSSGLEVKGKITATSGTIGGFNIGSRAIYNNISSFGGNQSSGVYLGTDGIQLGQNFKVTSTGAVTASSLTLKGTLTFLNNDGSVAGTMSAANLRSQVAHSYASTTAGGYCYGGAGGGYNFNNMANRAYTPSWVMCNNLAVGGSAAQWRSSSVMNSAGIPITISYLGYQT